VVPTIANALPPRPACKFIYRKSAPRPATLAVQFRLVFMIYKGIEYQVIQTANPSGWKWIVFLDETRTRTGISRSRTGAILDAESAINTVLKSSAEHSNGSR
jgi:hypothetical protein